MIGFRSGARGVYGSENEDWGLGGALTEMSVRWRWGGGGLHKWESESENDGEQKCKLQKSGGWLFQRKQARRWFHKSDDDWWLPHGSDVENGKATQTNR